VSRCILLLLVALLSPALTTLAYVDPPDPSWISGFWDDDLDCAIEAVLQCYAVEPESAGGVDVRGTSVARVVALSTDGSAPLRATATSPRGPPKTS